MSFYSYLKWVRPLVCPSGGELRGPCGTVRAQSGALPAGGCHSGAGRPSHLSLPGTLGGGQNTLERWRSSSLLHTQTQRLIHLSFIFSRSSEHKNRWVTFTHVCYRYHKKKESYSFNILVASKTKAVVPYTI